MRKINNVETIIQVAAVIKTERFITGDIHDVCALIDPYIDAYIELNDATEVKEAMLHGIHLAFWIMLDEKLKLPTDPLVFSNLMAKCFEYGEFNNRVGDMAFEKILESFDNLSREQITWIINLISLKSENYNLVLACLWSLLQIWDYFQKQDAVLQSIREKSTY